VHRFRDPVGLRLAGFLLIASLVGCGPTGPTATPSPDADLVTFDLQVLVRDGAIRTLDAECSGSSGFLYIHRGAPYWVEETADGRVALAGQLPAGTVVPAFPDDFGVPRVPSFCRFSWEVTLAADREYRLLLEEGDPVTFDLASLDAERRITVVVP
jgi:hypothetical protein